VITKKNVFAALSIGLCGLVWVPQLIGEDSPPPSTSANRGRMEPRETASSPATQPPSGSTTADVTGGALQETEALLSSLETFGGGAAGSRLTELVRSFDQRPEPALMDQQPDEETSGSTQAPAAQARQTGALALEQRSQLAEFASRNRLTGILSGGERALALVGSRVVAAGDRLWGGRIEVVEVSDEGVLLRAGDATTRLELPPFVARPGQGAPPAPSGQAIESSAPITHEPAPAQGSVREGGR